MRGGAGVGYKFQLSSAFSRQPWMKANSDQAGLPVCNTICTCVSRDFELAVRLLHNTGFVNPYRRRCEPGDLGQMLTARCSHGLITEVDLRRFDTKICSGRCEASEKELACHRSPI